MTRFCNDAALTRDNMFVGICFFNFIPNKKDVTGILVSARPLSLLIPSSFSSFDIVNLTLEFCSLIVAQLEFFLIYPCQRQPCYLILDVDVSSEGFASSLTGASSLEGFASSLTGASSLEDCASSLTGASSLEDCASSLTGASSLFGTSINFIRLFIYLSSDLPPVGSELDLVLRPLFVFLDPEDFLQKCKD
nr:hypothetical protein Iba_chr14aCG20330 [Ipomoea batatas]